MESLGSFEYWISGSRCSIIFLGVFYLKLKLITCLVLLDYSSIIFQAFSLVREVAIC